MQCTFLLSFSLLVIKISFSHHFVFSFHHTQNQKKMAEENIIENKILFVVVFQAVKKGNEELVKVLLQMKSEIVKILIEHRSNTDAQNKVLILF